MADSSGPAAVKLGKNDETNTHFVDDWRRGQVDVPSRAEAIRRMVELAVRVEKKSDSDH